MNSNAENTKNLGSIGGMNPRRTFREMERGGAFRFQQGAMIRVREEMLIAQPPSAMQTVRSLNQSQPVMRYV